MKKNLFKSRDKMLRLPRDIIRVIFGWLPDYDAGMLARTCHFLRESATPRERLLWAFAEPVSRRKRMEETITLMKKHATQLADQVPPDMHWVLALNPKVCLGCTRPYGVVHYDTDQCPYEHYVAFSECDECHATCAQPWITKPWCMVERSCTAKYQQVHMLFQEFIKCCNCGARARFDRGGCMQCMQFTCGNCKRRICHVCRNSYFAEVGLIDKHRCEGRVDRWTQYCSENKGKIIDKQFSDRNLNIQTAMKFIAIRLGKLIGDKSTICHICAITDNGSDITREHIIQAFGMKDVKKADGFADDHPFLLCFGENQEPDWSKMLVKQAQYVKTLGEIAANANE